LKEIYISNNDPKDSLEVQTLLEYKKRLETMRDMFSYELDFRRVTLRHIDDWESELRIIVAGIKRLENAPQTHSIISSCDGLQDTIWRAIQKLYIASDLIPKKSAKDRELVYRSFREIAIILKESIDDFYLF
jgi:hypothetical protein